MSRIVDNLIAYKVLSMMVAPFTDTPAYKLGIIDDKGNNLKKSSELSTPEEKDSYTYLHRLVFNLKRLLNKLPGGESKLKNLVAALFLVKEYYEKNDRSTSLMEDKLRRLVDLDVTLAEEQIIVEKFVRDTKELEEDGGGAAPAGGAPTNSTGAGVSTDLPVVKKKDINKYIAKNVGAIKLTRRAKPL